MSRLRRFSAKVPGDIVSRFRRFSAKFLGVWCLGSGDVRLRFRFMISRS